MNLCVEDKATIDAMDYRALLELWRNAPAGHSWFTHGDLFEYYKERMHKLRTSPGGQAAAVAASKSIGWEGEPADED